MQPVEVKLLSGFSSIYHAICTVNPMHVFVIAGELQVLVTCRAQRESAVLEKINGIRFMSNSELN